MRSFLVIFFTLVSLYCEASHQLFSLLEDSWIDIQEVPEAYDDPKSAPLMMRPFKWVPTGRPRRERPAQCSPERIANHYKAEDPGYLQSFFDECDESFVVL